MMQDNQHNIPYLRITEQPARNAVRFRYSCETRAPGVIPGVTSTASRPTYPTAEIVDYFGKRSLIVVSCVTSDQPYRQHPNRLVGSVGCRDGVCTLYNYNSSHTFEFQYLRIECAKRSEVKERLVLRQEMGCDPTNVGFEHLEKGISSIMTSNFCLCFQAFIENPITGAIDVPLAPVMSDPVYDKKVWPSLAITAISNTCCPMSGAKVILICNRIEENDIEVVFYRTDSDGRNVWEAKIDSKCPKVKLSRKGSLSFIAPSHPPNPTPVNVFLELRRPSDGCRSKPIVFTYLPECETCSLLALTLDIVKEPEKPLIKSGPNFEKLTQANGYLDNNHNCDNYNGDTDKNLDDYWLNKNLDDMDVVRIYLDSFAP